MADRIGPYRLDQELGRGSMGIVYRAFDEDIGRLVAVKIIRPQQQVAPEEQVESRLRFKREAAAAGKLSHPNIVVIYHLGETNGELFICMEFVAGLPLERALIPGSAMSAQTALSVLTQVASALDHAHAQGVIHRDIKPANILVSLDGQAKITDFGIARIASQTITQTGMTMGTPLYMAPEQILGAKVDGKADQFSLAVIAYRMLSGTFPFNGEPPTLMYHIVHSDPPRLDFINPQIPSACAQAIDRALAKKPEQRYQTCTGFVEELKQSFARQTPHPPPRPLKDATTRRTLKPNTQTALAVTGALLCAALVVGAIRAYVARTAATAGSPLVHTPSAATRQASPPIPNSFQKKAPAAKASQTASMLPGQVAPSSRPSGQARPAEGKAPGFAAPPEEPGVSRHTSVTKVNPKDGLRYVWIRPGTFTMGCSPSDTECSGDEKPAHQVTITKGFWIGQTPVTQDAYQRVTGDNPSYFKGPRLPVETVNWNEAQNYCHELNLRLPSEAEWEYAARAGSAGSRYEALEAIAWYLGNSGNQPHEVAQKRPNAWGLYDTLGNVWQWVADWFGTYHLDDISDPRGPPSGSLRIVRGGSWNINPKDARVSRRYSYEPEYRVTDIGFRCVGE